jgi:hypothetical protein
MNKETLEKMRWLYDAGFEPDMWIREAADDYSYFDLTSSKAYSEGRFVRPKPYFTESRLWSLLPKKITTNPRDEGYAYLAINKASILGYFGTWATKALEIDIKETDLHTALLDLTIWTVKEGHLKAEEKQ